jgi:hypothetical protein
MTQLTKEITRNVQQDVSSAQASAGIPEVRRVMIDAEAVEIVLGGLEVNEKAMEFLATV